MRWLFPTPAAPLSTPDPVVGLALRSEPSPLTHSGTWQAVVGWPLLIPLVLAAWWLITLAGAPGWARVSDSSAQIAWLFGVSVLANLLLDMACLIAGLSNLQRGLYTTHWDLLRLTGRLAAALVRASHTLAQVRVWRLTCCVFSLRVLVVLLALLTFVVVHDDDRDTGLVEYLNALPSEPTTLVTLLVTLPVFALVYMAEPLWRMRAMTTVGVWVARHRSITAGLLEGFGMIIGLAISQVLILAILFFALTQVAVILFGPPLFSSSQQATLDLIFQVIVAGACLLTGVIIYQYYAALMRYNLARAAAALEAG